MNLRVESLKEVEWNFINGNWTAQDNRLSHIVKIFNIINIFHNISTSLSFH